MHSKARWWFVVFVPLVIGGVVLGSALATFGPSWFGADTTSSTTTLTRPQPTGSGPSESPEPEAAEELAAAEATPTADPTPAKRKTKKPAATATRNTGADEEPTTEPTSVPRPAKSVAGGSTGNLLTDQVVTLTNAERADAGCRPLKVSAKLTKAAQAHSADMAKQDYFSHTAKDGRSPFDRITGTGYAYSAAAENIAAGQRTAADVVKGWMDSPGHRANIVNCTYTQIGVGYAAGGTYGTYWTQNFGRPA
jgi:uncharacterized protein YkwD